jgi:hypothetical protein
LNKSNEQFIPDGEWQGYYNYPSNGIENAMNCFFIFKDRTITGHGSDDIGYYTWNGNYDEDLNVLMIKHYSTHAVKYTGYADENGIWGDWKIFNTAGGFHLWPIKSDDEVMEEHEAENIATLIHQ